MTDQNKRLFAEAVKSCRARFGAQGWEALGPDICNAFVAKELFLLVAKSADNDDVSADVVRKRATALSDLYIEWCLATA